jgi:hypothetical protein
VSQPKTIDCLLKPFFIDIGQEYLGGICQRGLAISILSTKDILDGVERAFGKKYSTYSQKMQTMSMK